MIAARARTVARDLLVGPVDRGPVRLSLEWRSSRAR
jgi:hypothetical protein